MISPLQSCPLFSGMQDISQQMPFNPQHYLSDTTILAFDASIHAFGIIVEGSVQIEKFDYIGNRMIISQLHKGDLFAEVFVVAEVQRSPIQVHTITDCQIIWMSISQIQHLDEMQEKLIMRNLLRIIAQKTLFLRERSDYLAKRTIRDKLISYFSDLARQQHSNTITLPWKRQPLADFLSIDRSAMSRELKRLEREGVLCIHKQQIILKNTPYE